MPVSSSGLGGDAVQHAVLIAGDNSVVLGEVAQWVREETSVIETALSVQKALVLKSNIAFALVVLCFESIDESQKAWEQLSLSIEESGHELPSSVMMCKKSEMEAAFKLCDAGFIDDYVVFRPLYDPYRLQLVLRKGLRIQRLNDRNRRMAAGLKEISAKAKKLKESASRVIEQSTQIRSRTRQTLAGVSDGISDQVRVAREKLARAPVPEGEAGLENFYRILGEMEGDLLNKHLKPAESDIDGYRLFVINGGHRHSLD